MPIKPQVTGKLENEERRLETGSRVHRSELLKTGPQAQAELKLYDNTKNNDDRPKDSQGHTAPSYGQQRQRKLQDRDAIEGTFKKLSPF